MKASDLAIFAGLYFLIDSVKNVPNQVMIDYDSIHLEGIDFLGPAVRFKIRMKCVNQSGLSFEIDKVMANVFYMGKQLNQVTGDTVVVRANATTLMDYHSSLSINQIRMIFGSNWNELLANSKNYLHPSNFKMVGIVRLRYGNLTKDFDISKPFSITWS